MDLISYNREAWNSEVDKGNVWTQPVTPETIADAKRGIWQVVLTPTIPVPQEWFGPIVGKELLCLASGGGQQGPILAAAGAHVTVFDNSPKQLAQDRLVAEREALSIELVEGDMTHLDAFAEASFDLIFHPVSNCFVPAILPVWREAYRVLRPGGVMLAGFTNPLAFCGDPDTEEKGEFILKYPTPYSDLTSITEQERRRYTDKHEPLAFGHSLQDQIGGQLEAGFLLAGMFEDAGGDSVINQWTPGYIATRAIKPA